MEYHFHRLKNNLRVGTASLPGDGTATVLLIFKVGSKNDPVTKRGIAHCVEHMLFKGTKNRPARAQVERDIERLGGYFNGFTVKGFSWFYIKLLRKDLEKAIDVLHDVMLNSLFLPSELEREKRVILEEINNYNDSPADIAEDIFEKCLYGNESIAWPTLGEPKMIKKFKDTDLTGFFKKFYVAENAALIIAGGVSPEETLRLAEYYFSDFPSGKKMIDEAIIEKQIAPKIIVRCKKIDQSQIALGARAFSLDHKNHYPAKLIAILLGGNMSARLFVRLREELGLVYDINTMSEAKKDTGYLATYTGLKKNNIIIAVWEILRAQERLKHQEVDKNELEDAKNFLLNKRRILYENSDFVALDLAKRIIFKKRAVTFDNYQKEVKKVSSTDIKRVANDIFKNQNLNLAVVGPINKNEENKYKKILNFLY